MIQVRRSAKIRDRRIPRRVAERILSRNRRWLDQAGNVLVRQLDFWNRRLAEGAVPKARRERVAALARERARKDGRFRVVAASVRDSADRPA